MPGNIPPEAGKIEFLDSGQIHVPESIDTDGAPLPENIDDKYFVYIYYNDVKIDPNSYVFISAEPAMPKIRIETYIGKDYAQKVYDLGSKQNSNLQQAPLYMTEIDQKREHIF